jgi:type I restriction enzyme S subunit
MIKELLINIPPKSIMMKFKCIVENQFEKIRGNQVQIRILERLRDTLLPKLMSGEVGVEV